jgi:hypothetical protein
MNSSHTISLGFKEGSNNDHGSNTVALLGLEKAVNSGLLVILWLVLEFTNIQMYWGNAYQSNLHETSKHSPSKTVKK